MEAKKASAKAFWHKFVGMGLALLSLAWWCQGAAWAKPTESAQARRVVQNWLSLEAEPLGMVLGKGVSKVDTYRDNQGKPLYHVVHLAPQGLVFVPGDDLVEPIIGFLPGGRFVPTTDNPLGALVTRDIPGRVVKARQMEEEAQAKAERFVPSGRLRTSQQKWGLFDREQAPTVQEMGLPSVSDPRVGPLVGSRWSQTTVDNLPTGLACYNYYTPPNAAGSANNYPCGCVATAMAQHILYLKGLFPNYLTAGVGARNYEIFICGTSAIGTLRGGDSAGGPYDWANMTLKPKETTTISLENRKAIGALCHDTGVAVYTNYCSDGSGAELSFVAYAFVNTFGCSNARLGFDEINVNLPAVARNNMVNPNLDAGYPIFFSIKGGPGGHAVICDGYGYNASTLYHHVNFGAANESNSDAWYNLPTIDPPLGIWRYLDGCVYNVFTSGTGEIISGRVTESNGTTPVIDATVTATRSGGGTYTVTTNGKGIYALAKVPPASTYTISVTKTGYSFCDQEVTIDTSTDLTTTTGNLWGVDFIPKGTGIQEAVNSPCLCFTTAGDATWFPETTSFFFNHAAAQSGAISDGQWSELATTVKGPGTFSFYWKVSSEPNIDVLFFHIDGVQQDSIHGEVDWTKKSFTIPAGRHTVTWTYVKDGSVSVGSDCGWVDKVEWSGCGRRTPISQLLLLLLN